MRFIPNKEQTQTVREAANPPKTRHVCGRDGGLAVRLTFHAEWTIQPPEPVALRFFKVSCELVLVASSTAD